MEKSTCSIPPELVEVLRDSSKIKKIFTSHVLVRKITKSEIQKLTPKSFLSEQPHQAITDADTHAWGHYSENFSKFRMKPSEVIKNGDYVFPSAIDRIVMKSVGLMPQLTHAKAYSAVAQDLHKKVPILRIVLTPKRRRNPRSSLKSKPKTEIPKKIEVKTPKQASATTVAEPGSSCRSRSGAQPRSVRLTTRSRGKVMDAKAADKSDGEDYPFNFSTIFAVE